MLRRLSKTDRKRVLRKARARTWRIRWLSLKEGKLQHKQLRRQMREGDRIVIPQLGEVAFFHSVC